MQTLSIKRNTLKLYRLATMLAFAGITALSASEAVAQSVPTAPLCDETDCDDGDPTTLDYCMGQNECGHSAGFTACNDPEGAACSVPQGQIAPYVTTECEGFTFWDNAGVCQDGRCLKVKQGTDATCDECAADNDCNDNDSSTINWCNEGKCAQVEREDANCYDQQLFNYCWNDNGCDDNKADTVDWCNSWGECNHVPRSNDTGACEEPAQACLFNWECQDGDRDTKNWCHEGTCHSVQKDDPNCHLIWRWGGACERNRDCRKLAPELMEDHVTWCNESMCRYAPRDLEGGRCEEVLGNIKPAY